MLKDYLLYIQTQVIILLFKKPATRVLYNQELLCSWQHPLTGTASKHAILMPLPLSPTSLLLSSPETPECSSWNSETLSCSSSCLKGTYRLGTDAQCWNSPVEPMAAGVLRCCQTPTRLKKESDPQSRTHPSKALSTGSKQFHQSLHCSEPKEEDSRS